MTGLIDCFHSHAARERRVAYQSNYVMIITFAIARDSHPQSSRKGSGSRARAKCVVHRFVTPQETADSAILLDRRKLIAPACQNFVGVGLMPDIPHQPVAWGIERIMKRDR